MLVKTTILVQLKKGIEITDLRIILTKLTQLMVTNFKGFYPVEIC